MIRLYAEFKNIGMDTFVPIKISLNPFKENCYVTTLKDNDVVLNVYKDTYYEDWFPYNTTISDFCYYNPKTDLYLVDEPDDNEFISGFKYINYKEGVPIKVYFSKDYLI